MLSELWPEPDPLRVSGGRAAYSMLVSLPSKESAAKALLKVSDPRSRGMAGIKRAGITIKPAQQVSVPLS